MNYIKARDWDGKDLKGTWEVTLKIDGVRALWYNGGAHPTAHGQVAYGWFSRAGKPLFNIPAPQDRLGTMPGDRRPAVTDIEVYIHDRAPDQKACFKDTIRAVRSVTPKTQDGCSLKRCKCAPEMYNSLRPLECKNWELATPVIKPEHMYSLDPLDPRLGGAMWGGDKFSILVNPTADRILSMMYIANAHGYEGLVLRGKKLVSPKGAIEVYENVWLKVKPKPTWDVLILDVIEGTGKRKGHVGAFMTSKGKVGGFRGFDYKALKAMWDQHEGHVNDGGVTGVNRGELIGQTIEVEAMGLTPSGMFRQPRCIRFRPDKTAEE